MIRDIIAIDPVWQMRIHQGGFQIAMAHQLFHSHDVHPSADQPAGERVPKAVHGEMWIHPVEYLLDL